MRICKFVLMISITFLLTIGYLISSFCTGVAARYILRHKDPLSPMQLPIHFLSTVSRVHNTEFLFVEELSEKDTIELSSHYHIEKDQEVRIFKDQKPEPEITMFEKMTLSNLEWHLNRIDQRTLPLDNLPFVGDTLDNSNVDIYILDTGIDISHPEFEGRALWGANFVGDNIDTDCHFHGTHVASSAGGSTLGVARKSTLIAVKVLGCSGGGTYAGVISGIEWAVQRAQQTGKLSIINMSLGGPVSEAVDAAVESAFAAGVYVVVAAGNANTDACTFSPARASSAITVAASDALDNKADFSNWGTCVDFYAPGCVLGAVPDGGYQVMCGTSMASPIAAGVLATYISRLGRSGYNAFLQSATNDVIVGNAPGTPNKLVYLDPNEQTSSTVSSTCNPTATETMTSTATETMTSTETITTTFQTTTTTRTTITTTATRTTQVHHPAPTCVSEGFLIVRGSLSKWGAETACQRYSKKLVFMTSNNRDSAARALYNCHGDSLGWTGDTIRTSCIALQGSPSTGTIVSLPCTKRYPAICF